MTKRKKKRDDLTKLFERFLEAQSDKIAELEEQLNSVMENNIKMNSVNSELVREQVIAEVVSGLADTEIEKFKSLTEEIDFKDQDTFREKLDTLKSVYVQTKR